MVCVGSMCHSIMLSQFLRLLKSDYNKSLNHIGYWIGDFLDDLLPGIDSGPRAHEVPAYFDEIVALVMEARFDDLITQRGWHRLTNRMLYNNKREMFPLVKVEREEGISFKRAWKMIGSPALTSSVREMSYMLIHNKLPVTERMFRFGVNNDPYCVFCPRAAECDAEHFFCSCIRVSDVWSWIKKKILEISGENAPNKDLIKFFLPVSNKDTELAWLLASYYDYAWRRLHIKGEETLNFEKFFGFLTFKYRVDQQGSRPSLNIPGLI